MKFTRKQSAPIVIDSYGIQHPEITIKITALPEDKKNKKLSIYCSYYHNDETTQTLEIFGFGNFVFGFSDDYSVPSSESNLEYPTYSTVKKDIEIDDNGNIIIRNSNVPNWILNQKYIVDYEGKSFGENWEIAY